MPGVGWLRVETGGTRKAKMNVSKGWQAVGSKPGPPQHPQFSVVLWWLTGSGSIARLKTRTNFMINKTECNLEKALVSLRKTGLL